MIGIVVVASALFSALSAGISPGSALAQDQPAATSNARGAKAQTPVADSSKPVWRVIECRTGKDMTLVELADELAKRDIVFFGEEHENDPGHKAFSQLGKLLADRRPDFVISMEMFERDVQGVMNDYLRGKIDEATFLKNSRPWKYYARDYRPLVELAKERKQDVIGGNLPRPVASKIANGIVPLSPFVPRSTTAPLDKYWELFGDAMKGHPGADGMVERMYKSQCAKDDAMAEGISDYLAENPHRQPFVIHCCGNFHSDFGLGTAQRVAQRVPLAQIGILSMVDYIDVAKADPKEFRNKAHYLLLVPQTPRTSSKPKAKTPTDSKSTSKKKEEAAPKTAKPLEKK